LKTSISNLAWGNTPLNEVIPRLAEAGIQGIEVAPTAIWRDLGNVRNEDLFEFKKYLEDHNLSVSGVQSLLYGHPHLQLFDKKSWGDLRKHLEKVIRIGGLLGADVAVFGSPKNRIKGSLNLNQAHEIAQTFLNQLVPCLQDNSIVLTLEPNSPDYGADYLTTYEEVIELSIRIDSKSIKPQIDTGCLWMVGERPENAISRYMPHHIHLSVPNLKEIPGKYEFEEFMSRASLLNYDRWMVIEMLGTCADPLSNIFETLAWLQNREKNA
jgi:D-psicose/D-tagatose/L-ribulose 3-epimerase